MRRCGARKVEVRFPRFSRIAEVRIDVSAVKDVAGAVGVDDFFGRHRKRGHVPLIAPLVVPDEAVRPQSHAADAAALVLEQCAKTLRRQVELLAKPLRTNRNIDELKQLERVGAQAAAVERRENAALAAELRIMYRRIALV